MTAAAHDLVVRGALLLDGTGAPGREGDLAVSGERIAALGSVPGRGGEEIDGRGLVLAPGFIDPHTHLDANLFWDPALTPSSSFGVTTVVTGNCGYTLAPIAAETRDWVVELLSFVEQIPRHSIDAAVPFDWSDLPSYFARLAALPCLLNHATLVGHVPVRAAVLGAEAAPTREASPTEVERMAALVEQGLALGALGFSTDQVVGNFGPRGSALPGQVCGEDELLAVARALRRAPGPGLFAMANRALLQGRSEREADLLWHERLAQASGRPVVVGPIFDHFDDPGVGFDVMELTLARRRPGVSVVPQVSTRSFELWTRLDWPGSLGRCLPTLQRAQREGRAALERLVRDPAARARLREEAGHMPASLTFSGRWEHVFVKLARPEHAELVGPDLAALAAQRGQHPADLMLELAAAEDFETQFATAMRNTDDAQLGRMVAHPAAAIGASDAGAHVQINTDSCYAVWTLQHWVRERRMLSLERAIHLLTGAQADLLGLRDRGRLAPGLAADLVLFDPDRIATTGVRTADDQPNGGRRLVSDATGVALTLVNGAIATREGRPTRARPGRFLRPGAG